MKALWSAVMKRHPDPDAGLPIYQGNGATICCPAIYNHFGIASQTIKLWLFEEKVPGTVPFTASSDANFTAIWWKWGHDELTGGWHDMFNTFEDVLKEAWPELVPMEDKVEIQFWVRVREVKDV